MDTTAFILLTLCGLAAAAMIAYVVWHDHNNKGKRDISTKPVVESVVPAEEGALADETEFYSQLLSYTEAYEPEYVAIRWNDNIDRWHLEVTHDRVKNSYYGDTRLEALLKADYAARIDS